MFDRGKNKDDDSDDGIMPKIRTSTSKLSSKSEEYAREKANDDSRPTVDTSDVFGGKGDTAERVDYGTLNEIMDSIDTGDDVWSFLKENWYWIFAIFLGIGLFLFSFWENLTKHGHLRWYTGIVVMIPVMFGFAFWIRNKTMKDVNEKRFPTWVDVNSSRSYKFYPVKESGESKVVMPFTTDYKGEVHRPDNPYDKRRPLLVEIENDCYTNFSSGDEVGIITLGKLELDKTQKSTYRVTHDPAYVPSADAMQRNFEMKLLKMQLEMQKQVSLTRREMIEKISRADTGEWVKFALGVVKELLPVSKMMLRRDEGENVKDVRVVEALTKMGYIRDEDRSKALDAIKEMEGFGMR